MAITVPVSYTHLDVYKRQRVLKPGGKLLNFDANWYGYLYDEEKRLSYEEDRKSVESEHLDDHYLCTDIDRMEKIALQMPLSSINRPSWDRKFLKENGFESVAVDTGIWQRVWSCLLYTSRCV